MKTDQTMDVQVDMSLCWLHKSYCLCWGLMTCQPTKPLWVILSSPTEREKRDRRDSKGDEREGQGRKRNRNEREETEEIKAFSSTLTCYKDSKPCPNVKISVGYPGDVRYTTSSCAGSYIF